MTPSGPWGEFTRDPRRPEHAALRASDADRDVVHHALAEAYADGRLDREEFDARTEAVATARTLGDLPALMADLVPVTEPAGTSPAVPDLHAQAVARFEARRRSALAGFLTPTLVCWVIWAVTMFGGFPWPVFVMLGTGIGLLQTQLNRAEIIASEQRKLEKRQHKELGGASGTDGPAG